MKYELGRVRELWTKGEKGRPMRRVQEMELLAGIGPAESLNKPNTSRQVTLLAIEGWKGALADLGCSGVTLSPGARRANIVMEGFPSLGQLMGKELQIGDSRIAINPERWTRPCHQMDAIHPGLRAALEVGHRGGIYGIIVVSGLIKPGDTVFWVV